MARTRIRPPRPASLCSVFIQKVVSTKSGDVTAGHGTGFHYRGPDDTTWLVTNWHVLTGRRPDDPGSLLPNYPQSPDRIQVTMATKIKGSFTKPLELDLYQSGKPIWSEYKRSEGIDLAAIPIELPDFAATVTVQDFARDNETTLEPGIDVVLIGFPFEQTVDYPFPIWKRAMVASEPGFLILGAPQLLIDTPGVPGMSGSPVYRSAMGLAVTSEQYQAIKNFEKNGIGALDLVKTLSFEQLTDRGITLEFVGVYAGATGDQRLQHLNLGRVFMASFVSLLVTKSESGENPFPPQ